MKHPRPADDMLSSMRDGPKATDRSTTLNEFAPAVPVETLPLYLRIVRSRDVIPRSMLAAFLFISLTMVLTQAHRYGVTLDEPLQQQYGKDILAWYHSLGKNTSFLTAFPYRSYMPEHGGIFDAGVAALQHLLKGIDPWLVRRIVTGVSGWLGVVAIALCGYELGGPWVAVVAALGLWLYPRYYGAMFNNPKDIPAAMSFTFVVWATLKLVKQWNRRRPALATGALLGCCMGVATAIRITALTWLAVLAVLLVGWWITNGKFAWRERRIAKELAWQGIVAGAIAVSWLLSTMALWPFIFLNPFTNLMESIHVMTRYPWNGLVLFNGLTYPATQLPASYVPTWLVIGSPPLPLLLMVSGLVIVIVEAARTRRVDPVIGTAVLAFVIPLASLLLLHPVLYNSLRQYLYIIPPLILLAAYGLVRGVSLLLSRRRASLRWMAAAVLAATVVSYAQVITDMVALSPYEYIYFSPLVGGLNGAAGKFETDYYGSCSTAAARWLSQNYRHYTSAASPTLDASTLLWGPITPFLPATFRADRTHPDFFIAFTRNNSNLKYPTYRVIHVVAAEGVPLCVVKVNPAITQGQ